MSFRAFTLMLVLGLHSVASAATDLFHLCRGEAQFQRHCCCGKASDSAQAAGLEAADAACCVTPSFQRTAGPAAMPDVEKRGEAPRAAALPVARVVAPQPGGGLLVVRWMRAGGVRRATAPPLYIQHCSYLI